MYSETKKAVRKAFNIGKIIFSMDDRDYSNLLSATKKVKSPTTNDLSVLIEGGMSLEDALIAELKKRYKSAAVSAGFEERHGFAMLEYAALLEELK